MALLEHRKNYLSIPCTAVVICLKDQKQPRFDWGHLTYIEMQQMTQSGVPTERVGLLQLLMPAATLVPAS